MSYSTAAARQDLLAAVGDAIDDLARALAALGAAYELLDEHKAEELEVGLFGPVQVAYGRARRTYGDFARRHGLAPRAFTPATPGAPSGGLKGYVDDIVGAVASADATLATLQDSMLPVEVGDAELRAGLADVRELVADVVRDWARRSKADARLELRGPAGGSFTAGAGTSRLVADAVEFCRVLSGRGSADAFEIEVVEQESRSAEQLARFALEEASPSVRRTIQIAHRTLLRFQVGPASSRDHILGLTIVTSRPDVVVLEGVSHILRAVIVVKKTEPRRLLISTYVFYLRPAVAGLLLKIVGPVHRRIAPYLLERTAFTK
ncbi:MAG: hypothetical protein KY433_04010, partial [Actinobacteria bacterium]|nr:hypothetical protein [Actinomycetota bacterium]